MANSILERYKNIYRYNGGDTRDLEQYSIQSLCRRLHNTFNEYLLKIAADGKRGTVLYKNSGLSIGEAFSQAQESRYFKKDIVRHCASILRNESLSLERTPLDNNVNVDSIMKGEVTSPDMLEEFYRNLYTGSISVPDVTSRKKRLIESSCADAIYACSGSKLLPGKHLSLALALKSLTGSHTAVTLLNRFGHCASDETIRRIDMALEETVHKGDNDFVPKGIRKTPGLCTGTAWDNFGLNIETLSGIGTIHHTYGICYQNESDVLQDSAISFICTAGLVSKWHWNKQSMPRQKNRLKGIIAFADINSAVNRWLVTSSMRAHIINQILDIADMIPNTDPKNKELKRYRLEKDANDLSSLIDSIVDTLNPFQFGVN